MWIFEERSPEGYSAYITYTDYYGGEHHGYVQAHVNGTPIGYLNFSVYQKKARIKMIEVNPEWQRRGVAKHLFYMLADDVGGEENVEWGYMTPEGEALRSSIQKK